MLLREFAVFYRRTLEDSADLILFAREMEQTKRYFTFEIARFGEDRVAMEVDIEPRCRRHAGAALPASSRSWRTPCATPCRREGKLTISVTGQVKGDDVIVCVADDGVGMTEEARLQHPAPRVIHRPAASP